MTKLAIAIISSSYLGFLFSIFFSSACFPWRLLLLRHLLLLLLLLFSLSGNVAYFSFSFLILFSFDVLGVCGVMFFLLIRHDFFFGHNFYCLINLGDCFFFF